MATYLNKVKVGSKTYYISHSGKEVYYSSSNRTGGTRLKGVRFYNNQILDNKSNKPMSDFAIAQAIDSNKGGGCFLTTAVCDFLGKADDCHELQTLRWFRDNVMLKHKDWSELVKEYYEIAPPISDYISTLPLQDVEIIYEEFILSCLSLIEQKRYDETVKRYIEMINYVRDIKINNNCRIEYVD